VALVVVMVMVSGGWSELRARRIVLATCILAMSAFFIYSVIRMSADYKDPVNRFSTSEVSSLTAPAIIVCPDTTSNITTSYGNSTCAIVDPKDPDKQTRLCPWSVIKYRFPVIVTNKLLTCLLYPGGDELRDVRQLVRLLYTVTTPDPDLYFNIVYFATAPDVASLMTDGTPFVTSAIGKNTISFRVTKTTPLSGTSRYSTSVQSVSTAPALKRAISPGLYAPNTTTGVGAFYVFADELLVHNVDETLSFGVTDFFASLGGTLSLLAFAAEFLSGKGKHDPHGLIHQICYRHVLRRDRLQSTGGMNAQLAELRDATTATAATATTTTAAATDNTI
jgi:hypothetical protein